MSLTIIQEVKAALHRGEMSPEAAINKLVDEMASDNLAHFIVTAFDKGWVTNYNLGLNHEGKPL